MTRTAGSPNAAAVSMALTARAENVMLVRQSVEGAVARMGVTGQQLDDIKLAVTEACSNVVKHAYGGEAGPMSVAVDCIDGIVRLTVADSGSWREAGPAVAGRQHGMGLQIMKSVTDDCEIRRGVSGTDVVLAFKLDGDDAANGGGGDE